MSFRSFTEGRLGKTWQRFQGFLPDFWVLQSRGDFAYNEVFDSQVKWRSGICCLRQVRDLLVCLYTINNIGKHQARGRLGLIPRVLFTEPNSFSQLIATW